MKRIIDIDSIVINSDFVIDSLFTNGKKWFFFGDI